jgi:hypothetical protein
LHFEDVLQAPRGVCIRWSTGQHRGGHRASTLRSSRRPTGSSTWGPRRPQGGRVIAAGTPEDIAANPTALTHRRYLAERLAPTAEPQAGLTGRP